MSSSFPARRQEGLSLVELILFIVIVGIALAGIVTVMNLATRGSVDPMRRKQALNIAEGLLEEVEQARFSYCDPAAANADSAQSSAECEVPEAFGHEASEQQPALRPYDNVNDYVTAPGVAQAAFDVGGRLASANGAGIPVSGYTARLTVTPATLGQGAGQIGGGAGANPADTEVLRITVQVFYDGESVVLDGYRTRYAPRSL